MRTIRMNGLSPRPGVMQQVCQLFLEFSGGWNEERGVHVSHKMGNSLCSHPALLISAFGGIRSIRLRLRIRKSRKVEVSVCRCRQQTQSIVLVSVHHVRCTGEIRDPLTHLLVPSSLRTVKTGLLHRSGYVYCYLVSYFVLKETAQLRGGTSAEHCGNQEDQDRDMQSGRYKWQNLCA